MVGDYPLFDLDTKISNCRDCAKTVAFANKSSMITSEGQVRQRRPKQTKDIRDARGVFVKRTPTKTTANSKTDKNGEMSREQEERDIIDSLQLKSEEAVEKSILRSFDRLEELRAASGKKDLKTKHELIRQVTQVRAESNFNIRAIVRDRAKVQRKNVNFKTKIDAFQMWSVRSALSSMNCTRQQACPCLRLTRYPTILILNGKTRSMAPMSRNPPREPERNRRIPRHRVACRAKYAQPEV